jgi:hypothetical protein
MTIILTTCGELLFDVHKLAKYGLRMQYKYRFPRPLESSREQI